MFQLVIWLVAAALATQLYASDTQDDTDGALVHVRRGDDDEHLINEEWLDNRYDWVCMFGKPACYFYCWTKLSIAAQCHLNKCVCETGPLPGYFPMANYSNRPWTITYGEDGTQMS